MIEYSRILIASCFSPTYNHSGATITGQPTYKLRKKHPSAHMLTYNHKLTGQAMIVTYNHQQNIGHACADRPSNDCNLQPSAEHWPCMHTRVASYAHMKDQKKL